MKDTYISPEFREGMASWVKGMTEQGDQVRRAKSHLESLNQAIHFYESKLSRLENDPSRKQHTKHKAEIKYQIRRCEIEIAFARADWSAIPQTVKNFYIR